MAHKKFPLQTHLRHGRLLDGSGRLGVGQDIDHAGARRYLRLGHVQQPPRRGAAGVMHRLGQVAQPAGSWVQRGQSERDQCKASRARAEQRLLKVCESHE